MKKIKPEPLTNDAFAPFGSFANMINPDACHLGAPPIQFFRDMVQVNFGVEANTSFSTCRVEKREPVIDVVEYHTACGEGILPLDADVLIHVAPASAANAEPPLDDMRVFKVPKGTFVGLKPGVWHHAPFAVSAKEANVLIVLPERTYANDCVVVKLPQEKQVEISG